MGDILKEAIADAKAVRETALANAKMALEEAFTPQLKSMLSAKLKEDEFGDEEERVLAHAQRAEVLGQRCERWVDAAVHVGPVVQPSPLPEEPNNAVSAGSVARGAGLGSES